MHRHAVGDGRAPARIGAGIQFGMRPEAGELAISIAADARLDQRRMALGGSGHALRPRVDVGDRLVREPRRQRDQRVDVEIELAAEAAADRARDQAHRLLRQIEDLRQVIAMLERVLGGDVHLHRIALALGPAGFRLDIGVLDEAGLVFGLGHMRGLGERAGNVAAGHAAVGEDVLVLARMDRRRPLRRFDADDRRQRLIGDRHVLVADDVDRGARADEGDHRIATIAR
jgi:hypothetical protein